MYEHFSNLVVMVTKPWTLIPLFSSGVTDLLTIAEIVVYMVNYGTIDSDFS